MNYLTKQEIFDTVATHLLTQKQVSMVTHNDFLRPICAYRGDDGLKCAIGVLIKDEYYSEDLEGVAIEGKIIEALKNSGVNANDGEIVDLCTRLQNVHDYGSGSGLTFKPHDLPSFWRNELRIIARDFKLDDSVLNKV